MMRSKGIGGATAAEMSAYHAKKRPADKPPAGVKADLDAMKQEKANEAGMKAHEGRKLAGGGSVSSRADGCAQRGKTRGHIV
jgi:hypothetical protein